METPTADTARGISSLLLAVFPPAGDPENAVRLQAILDADAGVISQLTGRKIGPPDAPGEEVPDYLVPTAERAITLRAERPGASLTVKQRRGAISTLRLRSFSAGPYSESYERPDQIAKAHVLDPDPEVNQLLWALATEDMRDFWLYVWGEKGARPQVAVQGIFWNLRGFRGY